MIQLVVLYGEVSPNAEGDLCIALWLGQQTVSSFERCPKFRVSFI